MNLGFAVYHGKDGYLYTINKMTKVEYLSIHENTYPVALWVNEHVDAADKILALNGVRLFYFNPQIVRANEFFKKNSVTNLEGLVEELKSKEIKYLMISETSEELMLEEQNLLDKATLQKHFDLVCYDEQSAQSIYKLDEYENS